MASASCEEVLKNTLKSGEKILWKGRAEPFAVMDGTNKGKIVRNMVTSSVIIAAILIAYYVVAISRSIGAGQNIVITLLAVGIWGFTLSGPYTLTRKLMKETEYVFTNERAIMVGRFSAVALPISERTKCRIEKMDNGKDILYMGEAVNTKPAAARAVAVAGISDEKGGPTGLVFYSISDAEEICKAYTPLNLVDRVK